MIGIKGKRRSTSWSSCSVTVGVKFTVWFLHWENSDRMICCYLTHHILRLCRCHCIHRCHFDWLEDNISSSAVVWHSLLWFHHIISGSRMCQQSLAGASSQHPACRSMAVMGFTDNVNAVQEALWTAAPLLPPLPLPTMKKWPWIRNGNLVCWANTFSVKHCVYIWALPI